MVDLNWGSPQKAEFEKKQKNDIELSSETIWSLGSLPKRLKNGYT
jgi:hypothetical protein